MIKIGKEEYIDIADLVRKTLVKTSEFENGDMVLEFDDGSVITVSEKMEVVE